MTTHQRPHRQVILHEKKKEAAVMLSLHKQKKVGLHNSLEDKCPKRQVRAARYCGKVWCESLVLREPDKVDSKKALSPLKSRIKRKTQ
ncbi:hypothetical protein SKAU_G00174260 [Synaphobranchus kaupii]|uniref:Uncharacterized protein n=1 Tax=Synaphobranchus kaupii TaxID=118154 RepID=A0A9Q1J043_SYNKA|nr:hypothetical protein SKAU_G00174260 [Synaphobranchus kaupii]